MVSVEEEEKRTLPPSGLDLFSMVTPWRRNNLPEMAQLFRVGEGEVCKHVFTLWNYYVCPASGFVFSCFYFVSYSVAFHAVG